MEQVHTTISSREIAELCEQFCFDPGVAEILRDVFLRACHTLGVSEPVDPMCATIARTVIIIAIASENECDAAVLYKCTMDKLCPVH